MAHIDKDDSQNLNLEVSNHQTLKYEDEAAHEKRTKTRSLVVTVGDDC